MLVGWWLFRDAFSEQRWLRRFFALFLAFEFACWLGSAALVVYLVTRHQG